MKINDPNNFSEEKQIEFVSKPGDNIKLIKNQSEAVKLASINENSFSIKYINNPSAEIQLIAANKMKHYPYPNIVKQYLCYFTTKESLKILNNYLIMLEACE